MQNIKLQGLDTDGNEKEYSLQDFKGQKVVLYFYPKDNTSGCTQEACDFRDNINRLTKYATIIGVSPDSIKSHIKFKEKQISTSKNQSIRTDVIEEKEEETPVEE